MVERVDTALDVLSEFGHIPLKTRSVQARYEAGLIELHDKTGLHDWLILDAHCIGDRPGAYLRILREGTLVAGDAVTVVERPVV